MCPAGCGSTSATSPSPAESGPPGLRPGPADDTPAAGVRRPSGRTIGVPTGSVARVNFGPRTASPVKDAGRRAETSCTCTSRSRRAPRMLALWIADGPIVATFHTATSGPARCRRPPRCCGPAWRRSPPDRRLGDARRIWSSTSAATRSSSPTASTSTASRQRRPRVAGPGRLPTIAFLGRIDEDPQGAARAAARPSRGPRRGPGARLLVVGRGALPGPARSELLRDVAAADEFLGGITDDDRPTCWRSVDLYIRAKAASASCSWRR